MIVCVCKGVSDRQVQAALDQGACDFEELSAAVRGAGSDCGMCTEMLRGMLDARSPAGQMEERGGCHAKGKHQDR